MMAYRAIALFISLVIVVAGAVLYSPSTGAELTKHSVQIRLAFNNSADTQVTKAIITDTAAPLIKPNENSAIRKNAISQAIQGQPLRKQNPSDSKGSAPSSPDESRFTLPAGGGNIGDSSEANASEDSSSIGVGEGNGQAEGDSGTTGTNDSQAKPSDNKQELADVLAGYHSRIVALIKAKKQYPQIARRLGHQGIARLSFSLSSSGELISSSISKSSGFEELDNAALNSLKAVSRFPAFPSQLGSEPRDFEVSLNFTID